MLDKEKEPDSPARSPHPQLRGKVTIGREIVVEIGTIKLNFTKFGTVFLFILDSYNCP